MKVLSTSIICCGFTPCIQRMITFKSLQKGAVNRAQKVTIGIGGKGANTARMITQRGGQAQLIGFYGGKNGQLIQQMLQAEGVNSLGIEVSKETRICQTLLEEGSTEPTELVEEMPPLSEQDWAHMKILFKSLNLTQTILCISGKLPAGAPPQAYAQLVDLVHQQQGRTLIDTSGTPLLKTLPHHPFLVKINDHELQQTTGEPNLLKACQQLLQAGAQSLFITRGSQSALFVTPTQTIEIFPPKIKAVNPIGSGDAVTAGIALDLSQGIPLLDALTTGMACGAANALTQISGQLDPCEVNRLRKEVQHKIL